MATTYRPAVSYLEQSAASGILKAKLTDRLGKLTGKRPLHCMFSFSPSGEALNMKSIVVFQGHAGMSMTTQISRKGLEVDPGSLLDSIAARFAEQYRDGWPSKMNEQNFEQMLGRLEKTRIIWNEQNFEQMLGRLEKTRIIWDGNFACCECDSQTNGTLMCAGCGSFYCPECAGLDPRLCCDYVKEWEYELGISPTLVEPPDDPFHFNPPDPVVVEDPKISAWGSRMLTYVQQQACLEREKAHKAQVIKDLADNFERMHDQLKSQQATGSGASRQIIYDDPITTKFWAESLEKEAMKQSTFSQMKQQWQKPNAVIHIDPALPPLSTFPVGKITAFPTEAEARVTLKKLAALTRIKNKPP